jgi:hypothetical protein
MIGKWNARHPHTLQVVCSQIISLGLTITANGPTKFTVRRIQLAMGNSMYGFMHKLYNYKIPIT